MVLFSGVVLLQRHARAVPDWIRSDFAGQERFQVLFRDLSNIMSRTVPWMGRFIPLSLALPILFFPSIRSGEEWQSFIIAFVLLLLYPGIRNLEREQWTRGLIYITVFGLLVYLNLYGPAWTPDYLHVITALILLWVVLKMLFKRYGDVVLTSGFEVLMIFFAWCLPTLLIRALDMPAEARRLILHSCLEAVPFLFATKIIIRVDQRAEKVTVYSIAGIFVLIGIRQYLAPLHH